MYQNVLLRVLGSRRGGGSMTNVILTPLLIFFSFFLGLNYISVLFN